MPVEKSGQNEFDFQYGEDFGAHIEDFDPDFSKVLVRYNPDDPDVEMNQRQLRRLKELADWLHAQKDDSRAAQPDDSGAALSGEAGGRAGGRPESEAGSRAGGRRERRFLFELLVPATDHQLAGVNGDSDRYDGELRPELMRRAITDIQAFGIEADVWKIEGVDARDDAAMLAEQARSGDGREGVTCVVLGRGASTAKVEQWLEAAATVEGFVGFAIGRSIWWDALKGFLAHQLERSAAAAQIAENYLRFVQVYEGQQVH